MLIRLIKAIIIDDDLEESSYTITETEYVTDGEDSETENENDESKNDQNDTIVEKGDLDPPPGSSAMALKEDGLFNLTLIEKQVNADTKKGLTPKREAQICKFFKNGRCKKEEGECKFAHPRICRKFNQFGPKEGNNKGCGENCSFFHPNA